MNKYVFKKYPDNTNEYDNVEVTFEFEATTKDELVETFKEFLMAVGFGVKREKCLECGD